MSSTDQPYGTFNFPPQSTKMATKSDQAALHHSSIALLQERFKQLQRTREMREERQLFRLLSETSGQHTSSYSSSSPSTMHYQPSSAAFYNSEMFLHQRPSFQPALSLWPDTQMNPANFAGLDQSVPQDHTRSWPCGTSTTGNTSTTMNKFDDMSSDVDTSLHL